MNEKERELELFNRSEKREVLKTRFEIERKLRMAKKKEMIQSQTKMRSNERRRTIEEKRKVKNAIKGLKGEFSVFWSFVVTKPPPYLTQNKEKSVKRKFKDSEP